MTENIIEEHLPEQLLPIIDIHQGLEEKIKYYDRRVIEKEELLPVNTTVKTYKVYPNILYISNWLWVLLTILLITERIISNFKKQ